MIDTEKFPPLRVEALTPRRTMLSCGLVIVTGRTRLQYEAHPSSPRSYARWPCSTLMRFSSLKRPHLYLLLLLFALGTLIRSLNPIAIRLSMPDREP